MSTSLSKLVDNLSERLHNNRCVDCKSCLDYMIKVIKTSTKSWVKIERGS